MKAIKVFLLFIVGVWMLWSVMSCHPEVVACTERNYPYCSPCQNPGGIVSEYCHCERDTAFYCPSTTVHATYNYQVCDCECDYGWTGTNCDEPDTTHNFVSFRYGADTSAPGFLKTIHLTLRIEHDGSILTGTYPPGGVIDSVKFGNFPGWVGVVPLCGGSCAYMEIYFANGLKAFSVSGNLTTDDNGVIGFMRKGTFNSDLYVSGTGQLYYVREGVFDLPY